MGKIVVVRFFFCRIYLDRRTLWWFITFYVSRLLTIIGYNPFRRNNSSLNPFIIINNDHLSSNYHIYLFSYIL